MSDYLPRPLPCGPNALVEVQFVSEERVATLALYDQLTEDPSELRPQVRQCIEATFRSNTTNGPPVELRDQAAGLLAAGSADPILRYRYAMLLYETGKKKDANALLEELEKVFAGDRYPPNWRYVVSQFRWLAALARDNKPKLIERLTRETLNRLADWAAWPGAVGYWAQQIARSVQSLEGLDETHLAVLEQAASRAADPWLADVIRGYIHIQQAWRHRGSGYADSVSRLAWKRFEGELEQARQRLAAACDAQPQRPEAAGLMITVAMASRGHASPREWFDRAVSAQFDYEDAYQKFSLSLWPRWGGSHEAMLEFGKECLATRRFDTKIPEFFLELVEQVDCELGQTGEIWLHETVVEPLIEFLPLIAAGIESGANPQPRRSAEYYRAFHAALAVRVLRWPVAHAAFEALGERASPELFARFGVDLEEERGRASLFAGPHSALAHEAEQMWQLKEYETAAERYGELAEKAPAGSLRTFLRGRRQRCAWQAQLRSGGWVPLAFTPELEGWLTPVPKSKAAVQSTETVSLSGSKRRGVALLAELDPGDRFLLEADVHLQGPEEETHFGLFWGQWMGEFPDGVWAAINRFPEGATVFRGMAVSSTLATPVSGPTRLRLEVWDGDLRYLVDGTPMVQQAHDSGPLPEGVQIGLASMRDTELVAGPISVSRVRIRRGTMPLPKESDHAGWIRYADDLVARDPADPVGWTTRATAHLAAGDAAAAERDAHGALALAPGDMYSRYLLCRTALASGRIEEGLAALAELVSKIPWYGPVQRAYVEALKQAGRKEEATEAMQAALEMCPHDTQLEKLRKKHFKKLANPLAEDNEAVDMARQAMLDAQAQLMKTMGQSAKGAIDFIRRQFGAGDGG